MTTPVTTSNKTALRASLKKEDESLAERLVATDVPLVAQPEPPASTAAPVRKVEAEPVVAKPTVARPATAKPADKPVAKPTATVTPVATGKAPKGQEGLVKAGTPVKAKSRDTITPEQKAPAKTAPSVAASASPAKAKPASKKAAATVKSSAPAKPAKPQGRVEAAVGTARQVAGKKAAKFEQAVGKLEKAAKEKGDKLVRYSVELLKSEEAAIDALRAELSKAAGWAASKSDILRAGARLFAEQKVEQMKDLLARLAAASKARK